VDLAAKARGLDPEVGSSAWAGHEYGVGYGVLSLPFDSGHLLGLRAFPQNDFAPFVSLWHRPPGAGWAIYVDGPSLDTACPRYWGPATERTALADIELEWTGPCELHVRMDEPRLEWRMQLGASPVLRALNAVESVLPLWTWRLAALRGVREWIARHYLGYGDIDLAFATASGHETVLLARENYRIEEATARLEGESLGAPTTLQEPPTIGGVALPRAPSFAFGQVQAAIQDPEEYERARSLARVG
jgi:hypothetical protein